MNHNNSAASEIKGWVFNIQSYSIQDGPGIRTTVFLKGCPLSCLWCSNPESQEKEAQLFFIESLCDKSHDYCIKACPQGVIQALADGTRKIDRSRCDNCGKCTRVCPKEALVITGKLMSVSEVIEEVRKDGLIYRNSGGGVTLSGGEPAYQPEFAGELLKQCQRLMFHTCLDTAGYVRWEVLQGLLEHIDLVLYDIKHLDSAKHRELTGVGNELILENAEKIVRSGKPLIVRVPLIPQCNDSAENILALGNFIKKLGVSELDILPYHQLGRKKYDSLGMEYRISHLKSFTKERVTEIVATLESIVGSHCEVKLI